MTRARLSGPVLVTGATGMLGSELLRSAPAGVEALGSGRSTTKPVAFPGVDLAAPGAAEALLARIPGLAGVLNCAAHTAVDKA
ncbi:MAG: sugar nucleotide-binding protein, partial [Planctomycetota bacterium]